MSLSFDAERPNTLREAYLQASSFLRQNESGQDPDRVVRLLLEHVLGYTRTELLLGWDEAFPAESWTAWRRAVERKASGEPVQYILGTEEFYGEAFCVTPAVLIPRPETELLVERIAELGARLRLPGEAAPTVVDVGTGSGAIAVTLARLHPVWRLIATDLSDEALAIATANAATHGVAARVSFVQGDLLEPLIASGERIDILVSNPPYIPAAELPGLQREVRDYEPMQALDGGEDGLEPYRRMLARLDALPQPPYLIGFELGLGQPQTVAAWLRGLPYDYETEIITDLAGIERHVIAWRSKGLELEVGGPR